MQRLGNVSAKNKRWLTMFGVFLLSQFMLNACANLPAPPAPAKRQPLLISNIHVVDVVHGNLLLSQDVLIEDLQIVSIRPHVARNTSLPVSAQPTMLHIDGSNRFLMPGLWDMHTHSMKLSPQLHHPLYLSHGVTYLRDMSGCMQAEDSFQACPADRQRWQQELLTSRRSSPYYVMQSSYALNGGKEVPAGYPDFLRLQSAAHAGQVVQHYQALGVNQLKTYEFLSKQQLDWLSEAAAQHQLQLAGHLPWNVTLTEGIAAGIRSFEHGRLFFFACSALGQQLKQQPYSSALTTSQRWRALLAQEDPAICQQQMQALAQSNSWWTPTLTTLQMAARADEPAFRQDPRLLSVPWLLRHLWQSDADAMLARENDGNAYHDALLQRAQQHVRQAKQAGVKILAGTDAPDSFVYAGSSLHDELALYVQAGLTPLQALQSATIDAARFSGMAAEHGSIAVGKHANLIMLSANPLEDIAALRQPEGLILAGHWYNKQALTAQYDFAVQQAGRAMINWQLFWSALQSPAFRRQVAD